MLFNRGGAAVGRVELWAKGVRQFGQKRSVRLARSRGADLARLTFHVLLFALLLSAFRALGEGW